MDTKEMYEAKKYKRYFAVIYFKGGKTKKVYGYEVAEDAAYYHDGCWKAEIYRERNDGCAADFIGSYEVRH